MESNVEAQPLSIQPLDFRLLRNAQQTLHLVSEYGRMLYPSDLHAAVKAGYLKPILVAGRKLYYLPDIEAFAKKWNERAIKQGATV